MKNVKNVKEAILSVLSHRKTAVTLPKLVSAVNKWFPAEPKTVRNRLGELVASGAVKKDVFVYLNRDTGRYRAGYLIY